MQYQACKLLYFPLFLYFTFQSIYNSFYVILTEKVINIFHFCNELCLMTFSVHRINDTIHIEKQKAKSSGPTGSSAWKHIVYCVIYTQKILVCTNLLKVGTKKRCIVRPKFDAIIRLLTAKSLHLGLLNIFGYIKQKYWKGPIA